MRFQQGVAGADRWDRKSGGPACRRRRRRGRAAHRGALRFRVGRASAAARGRRRAGAAPRREEFEQILAPTPRTAAAGRASSSRRSRPAAPPAATTPPPPPPPPATFTVGVTDYTFNPTNAIFGRTLKTKNGHVVTQAYWLQKEAESHDEVPYYEFKG